MGFRSFILAGLASCLAACATTPTGQNADGVMDRAAIGDSYLSDFYQFADAMPTRNGVLLRREELGERQSLENAAINIRLLYSSTDGLVPNAIVPVSGALYLPHGEAPSGGWPLMAWTHGTVGVADVCAPSWNGRQAQDEDYLNRFLAAGYAVVASDYQGLGTKGTHPYLATRPAAYSNLDIIRAVQTAEFPVSDSVVLFGQSQGAAAAIATADYAKEYAPDIQIAGVVATGAPYFTAAALDVLERLQKPDAVDPLLGYTFLAMTLVQQVDATFDMRKTITDEAWPIARRVHDTCYKDIKTMVVEAQLTRRNSFAQPPAKAMRDGFGMMGYPTLKLSAPIFFGTGGKDRDTPPRMQAGLVRDLCKAGTRVTSVLYPDLNHREVVPASPTDSMPFVQAAFAGKKLEGNCDRLPF